MKYLAALALSLLMSVPVFADGHLDAETIGKIEAVLAAMECQMDPDDIEVIETGYDLDDVICKGGNQFDIELDKDLKEVGRRAE